MLLASFSSRRPRAMEMGTAAPTPIRSARAKLMMTKGMARFRAAKEVLPRNCPTNRPSKSWYKAEASMLTEPGRAAVKNSLTGGVLANKTLGSIGCDTSLTGMCRRGRGRGAAAAGPAAGRKRRRPPQTGGSTALRSPPGRPAPPSTCRRAARRRTGSPPG